jgi:alpha-beta hydrolase superfamily lysophospholipase
MTLSRPLGALAAATLLLLSACGGGGDEPRGTVVSASVVGSLSTGQIDAGTQASGLQALSGSAQCGVVAHQVRYVTRDPRGREAEATTGVLVPSGTSAACSGARPVVLYAHGTSVDSGKNMANLADGETQLVLAMFAAQGYIVVAPNYLGYTGSSQSWHPYLNAEAQAVDMVDGLRAARRALQVAGGPQPTGALFVTGYSQGGHVAMATHRTLQRDHAGEFTVAASGPMAGPYNLAEFGRLINEAQQINAGAVLFTPLLLTSYQRSYGDVYTSTAQAYNAAYASTIESLLPSTSSVNELIGLGRLPADPTLTVKLFQNSAHPDGLILDSYRLDYVNNPNNGFRRAMERNTLLGWTPTSPVAMCSGAQDPTVFFHINQPVMQADLNSRLPAQMQALGFDLEDRDTLPAGAVGDAIYAGFQNAKTNAGGNVVAQYHGELVPPFCTALIRGFFQQVQALQ